ncbi:putative calcium-binding protein C50C3.5 [Lampetra fluviatilis]
MAQVNEDMLLKLFKAIDTDNSGTLSAKEILAVLNDPKLKSPKKHTLKEVEDLVGAIDSSGDGKVDFKEFLQVFKSK